MGWKGNGRVEVTGNSRSETRRQVMKGLRTENGNTRGEGDPECDRE